MHVTTLLTTLQLLYGTVIGTSYNTPGYMPGINLYIPVVPCFLQEVRLHMLLIVHSL